MSLLPATRHTGSDDEGDFIIEDVDLTDDTELLRMADVVEDLMGGTARLRVTPLSSSQWETVINALPAWMRKGQEKHIHVLPDRRERQHLLVSPDAVQGINGASRLIYHSIVSAMIRAVPSELPAGALRRGVNELMIEAAGERLQMPLAARTYPAEARFVRALLQVLVAEYGFDETEWALVLRHSPQRFLLALRKSQFGAAWLSAAMADPVISETLKGAGNRKRVLLCEQLHNEAFLPDSPLGRLTTEAALAHINPEDSSR